jgi:hypothetical protein
MSYFGGKMKPFARFAAAALAAGSFATTVNAAVNLLSAPGFEPPTAPSAATADQKMPGPFSPSVPATQNPWFYILDNTGATGAYGSYSSDIPAFSGTTPSNRLNSLPTGATNQNYKANDGDQYGYAYTVGESSGQTTAIAQGVTGIVAGDTYNASAYFFMKNNTSGTGADGDRLQAGASYDSLRLIFLDSSGAVISSAQSPTHVDSTTTANTWTQLSFSATAPANAVSVVFENLLTRGSSGGVMFVDSASLTDTPEPTSFGLLAGGASLLIARRRR